MAASLGVLLLLVVQDLRNVYGDQSERAWSWFAATVLPTPTVIVGTVVNQARTKPAPASVEPTVFYLTVGLSAFYLVLVIGTLLYQPLSELTPLELLGRSARFLAPVQGLVALGAFFGSRGA